MVDPDDLTAVDRGSKDLDYLQSKFFSKHSQWRCVEVEFISSWFPGNPRWIRSDRVGLPETAESK